MKYFDFDKFSKSSWLGSSPNRVWKKYGIKTHTDSAKDERGEHNFLTPPSTQLGTPYTERCVCGWSGSSWADHLEAAVDGEPKQAADQQVPAEEPTAPAKRSNKKITAGSQTDSVTEVAVENPVKGSE